MQRTQPYLRVFAFAFILIALWWFLNVPRTVNAAPAADRNANYQPGAFTFGNTQVLNPTVLTGFNLEPEIKVDLFGNVYVTAMEGVPGGVDLWKSVDKGQSFTYLGQPDGATCPTPPTCVNGIGLGGGDDSIDVSTGGYIYVSSLWLGASTMSTSMNGGFAPWQVNPAAGNTPVQDRQWIAAYGPDTVYISTTQVGSGLIIVSKSTDAGATFPQVTPVYPADSEVLSEVQGNLVVDPYNGNVYVVFVADDVNGHDNTEIYVGRSTDGGTSFTLHQAYNSPADTSNVHIFPSMTVDRGGNLHVAFSRCLLTVVGTLTRRSQCQIYMVSSPDAGDTWLDAVRVSNGSETATAVMPRINSGSPGVVNISWYGTNGLSPDDNNDWYLYFAQTRNALDDAPTFDQVKAIP